MPRATPLRVRIVVSVVLTLASTQVAFSASLGGGYGHTCGITAAGRVRCWGDNERGQLGDGTTTSRPTGVDVTGLGSGVATLGAGAFHTCVLTAAGGVKCWGQNDFGQLGDGTTTNRPTPVDVSGLTSGVVALGVGFYHACVVTAAGGVKCWGRNLYGALGDGTTTNRPTPVDVSGLASGVAVVTAGFDHSCALTTANGLKCWGSNSDGRLGDGTSTDRRTPVDVQGLTSGVTAVSAGANHTCALTTAGGVQCWGNDAFGQLGDGSRIPPYRFTAADVSGLTSGIVAIGAGALHTCALTATGAVKCWGANEKGQLGDGTMTVRLTPIDVTTLGTSVSELAVGEYHTCVVTTPGAAECWGNNSDGQLGDGTTAVRLAPVDVAGLASGVTRLAAGERHTCAATSPADFRCWGYNYFGQLGDGHQGTGRFPDNAPVPVDASAVTFDVTAFAGGWGHTCAVTSTGAVKCWGDNDNGQLGDGTTTDRMTPVDVSGLASNVTAVTAGLYFNCALTDAGGVKCWGQGIYGQLGDNGGTNRTTPVDVSGLASGVTAIAAGQFHVCALLATGGVKCWGLGSSGQLGGAGFPYVPVTVSGLTNAVAITAGRGHTCALTATGGVKCWGDNSVRQVGDGTSANRSTPVNVVGLTSGVAAVEAGKDFTCAILTAGGVKCWGANASGQLGDGTTEFRTTVVDAVMVPSDVTTIAAGEAHACALTPAGGVVCWGFGGDGETGDGHGTTPVTVVGFQCGDGVLQPGSGEDCDLGSATNGSASACCTTACRYRPVDTICRTAIGVCDVPEACTGTSATCPADALAPSDTVCRLVAGPCDVEEHCTGSTAVCPADQKSTATCRAAVDVCDAPEACDGVHNTCPANALQPSGTVCRPAAGACDLAESCTGTDASCPADVFWPSGVVCRGAADVCDLEEHCTGDGPGCPFDAVQLNGVPCPNDGNPCTTDRCDGASVACQHAAGNAGATCRAQAGVCDVAETCTGTSTTCPADAFRSSATTCRPAAGICDVAESCTGASATCPANGFASSATECRAAAGPCDVAETCTGTTATCPANGFASGATTCRAAAGPCDVAESCSGSSPTCPADAFAPATTVCRPATGDCNLAESCTGGDAVCPVDASEPDGTPCDDGMTCTVADTCVGGICSGDSATCGDGVVQSSCGEECDDGNTTSGDGCSASCRPEFACGPAPENGCKAPIAAGASKIRLKDAASDAADALGWSWAKGAATTLAELGDPTTTTDYLLCVYESGPGLDEGHGLVLSANAPASPAWIARSSGVKYKNKAAAPDGLTAIAVKPGEAGRAKIVLKGKGIALAMPSLPMSARITVQLRNSDGACWESIYDLPASKNDPTRYEDKSN